MTAEKLGLGKVIVKADSERSCFARIIKEKKKKMPTIDKFHFPEHRDIQQFLF